jgi:hypothetical protein
LDEVRLSVEVKFVTEVREEDTGVWDTLVLCIKEEIEVEVEMEMEVELEVEVKIGVEGTEGGGFF